MLPRHLHKHADDWRNRRTQNAFKNGKTQWTTYHLKPIWVYFSLLLLVNIAHFSYINERYGFDLYNNALIQSCFTDKTIFVRDSRIPWFCAWLINVSHAEWRKMYNKHSVTLNISQNVRSHHAKPFVIQFVGQKTRFRTKTTRVGRFLWKSTI